MAKVLNFVLNFLGVAFILLVLAGYRFYRYLFEREYKYHEVKEPEVAARLEQ